MHSRDSMNRAKITINMWPALYSLPSTFATIPSFTYSCFTLWGIALLAKTEVTSHTPSRQNAVPRSPHCTTLGFGRQQGPCREGWLYSARFLSHHGPHHWPAWPFHQRSIPLPYPEPRKEWIIILSGFCQIPTLQQAVCQGFTHINYNPYPRLTESNTKEVSEACICPSSESGKG